MPDSKLLLRGYASPWSDQAIDFNMLCRDQPEIINLLKTSRQMRIIMQLHKTEDHNDIWYVAIQNYLPLVGKA